MKATKRKKPLTLEKRDRLAMRKAWLDGERRVVGGQGLRVFTAKGHAPGRGPL